MPQGAQLVIGEDARARLFRSDDLRRAHAVSRRGLKAVNAAVDRPTEQSAGAGVDMVSLRWRAAVDRRVDHCKHVVARDVGDWAFSPQRQELTPYVTLDFGCPAQASPLHVGEVVLAH